MREEITTVSADQFKGKESYEEVYTFPFKPLDDTPGGSNLGRIEWHIEPVRGTRKKHGRYYIEKILLWAQQTRDEKYKGKLFEIPCFTEMIDGSAYSKEPLLGHISHIGFCDKHKNIIISTYPKNHHTKLILRVGNSILTDIYFE